MTKEINRLSELLKSLMPMDYNRHKENSNEYIDQYKENSNEYLDQYKEIGKENGRVRFFRD